MPMAKVAAGALGAGYVVVAIAGFFVTRLAGDGTLVVFEVSPLHNVLHLVVGGAGVAAYLWGPAFTRLFCQVAGVVLAVLAVAGIIVGNPLGLLPIGGFDVVLHAATALVLLFVGFAGADAAAAA